jgi:hypothetical protein
MFDMWKDVYKYLMRYSASPTKTTTDKSRRVATKMMNPVDALVAAKNRAAVGMAHAMLDDGADDGGVEQIEDFFYVDLTPVDSPAEPASGQAIATPHASF